MNRTTYLGELEHMVLLAVHGLAPEAEGRAIRAELARRVGREVSRSTAHITLERLVAKRYLEARMADPDDSRGGRARRYFAITSSGRAALRESGRALMRMWAGQEALLEER
jgi:PadR family transcriptional regulator PadR